MKRRSFVGFVGKILTVLVGTRFLSFDDDDDDDDDDSDRLTPSWKESDFTDIHRKMNDMISGRTAGYRPGHSQYIYTPTQWAEYDWLGVGRIRFGVYSKNGEPVVRYEHIVTRSDLV